MFKYIYRLSVTQSLILDFELYRIELTTGEEKALRSLGYHCKTNADKIRKKIIKELNAILNQAVANLNDLPEVLVSNSNPIMDKYIEQAVGHYNKCIHANSLLAHDLCNLIQDLAKNGLNSYIRDIPLDVLTRMVMCELFDSIPLD